MAAVAGQRFLIPQNPTQKYEKELDSKIKKPWTLKPNIDTIYLHKPQNTSGEKKTTYSYKFYLASESRSTTIRNIIDLKTREPPK